LSVLHVNKGHLEVMYDTDDEETQRGQRPWLPSSRGAGRGRDLLATGQWSLNSTVIADGTTLVDTVPMGYGRPRGDATTCPMDESMTPPHCDRAGPSGSRWRWVGYTSHRQHIKNQLTVHENVTRHGDSFICIDEQCWGNNVFAHCGVVPVV